MIIPARYYEVHCDRCNDLLDIDGTIPWRTEDEADDALRTYGWQRQPSGKVICDQCLLTDKLNEKLKHNDSTE